MTNAPAPRPRRLPRLAAALGIGAVAVVGIAWSQRPAPAAPPPSAPATTALIAPGLVEAAGDRVELGVETSGRLIELLVDEGDAVTAGQLLGRLDDRVARARVARAEAGLAAATARRALLARGARPGELRAAAAEAAAAEAVAHERGLARDRAVALATANASAIAPAEVDVAQGQADTSAATARAATARAAVLWQGARREELTEAAAAIAAARAEVDEAEAVLAHHELRAPRDGVILRRLHEVGEQMTTMPPTTLLIIADTRHLELRVEVDEADVGRVAVGQPAWASALAYGDRRFVGQVTRIVGELGRKTQRLDDPRARIDTRVLEVVVALTEPAALPLGLRMDVHLAPLGTAP
ncbi:MAG: efflux RND transporter periplasmic adaptor subunit [Myxococcales bacterium]|nr:efflux RND transporter periplasmic adaptor subunit [Myxococcales bacterium]